MKVAHLIDSAGLYGAEQVLLTLCKQQQIQGLNPVIVSCGLPGEKEKAIEVAAKQQGIEFLQWRMPAGIKLKETKKLLSILKKSGVKLLHSHGYKFNILLGLLSKSTIGLPRISTVHGYVKAKFPKKMWAYELLDRLMLSQFDATVLVSEKMREIPAFKRGKNIYVIKNGISSAYSGPYSLLDSAPFELLAVGRLSSEKGFEYLIRAVAEINKLKTACKLIIYGDGSLREQHQTLIAELNQQEHIQLAGFIADAQQYFHKYQLIVMPSLTEGVPITLLEAMRNRTPIMASAVGGIPDVLGQSSQCLLKPGSVVDITNKLNAWISLKPEEKAFIVERNYSRFFNEFTAVKMADQYLKVYKKSLSNFGRFE